MPALPTFITGKIVAAALSVNTYEPSEAKIAYLDGNPAADMVQNSNLLANDYLYVSSAGIIRNNTTPYSCCLAGYPTHSVEMPYSFVTGTLTLSRLAIVRTAGSPRDPQINYEMVRQDGDLALQDADQVLVGQTYAEWRGQSTSSYGVSGPLSSDYFLQLQVSNHTEPSDFRLCWHVYAPLVRRLACSIHSRADGSFKSNQVIDDSNGTGPRTFRPLNAQ